MCLFSIFSIQEHIEKITSNLLSLNKFLYYAYQKVLRKDASKKVNDGAFNNKNHKILESEGLNNNFTDEAQRGSPLV